MRVENDGHHILHSKRSWSMYAESLQMRENHTLIPKIDRDTHEALHRACPPVPLLGYHALQRTIRLWTPDEDTLKSVDNLMFAIEEASWHPKSHPIESALAELAIQAIDLQKPFIREGLGLHIRSAA